MLWIDCFVLRRSLEPLREPGQWERDPGLPVHASD